MPRRVVGGGAGGAALGLPLAPLKSPALRDWGMWVARKGDVPCGARAAKAGGDPPCLVELRMPAGSAEPWLRAQLQPRSIRRPVRHETQNMPLCWPRPQPGLLAGPSHNSGPHQWRPPRAPHRLRKLRDGSDAPVDLLLVHGVSAPEWVMSVRDSPGRRRSRRWGSPLYDAGVRAVWGTWPAGDGDRFIGVAVYRHDQPSRIQDPARHRWVQALLRQPPTTATPAPKKPKSGYHCHAPDGCRRKKPRPATRRA